MDKEIQIWKKQEKRIVRLLYRKGLLSDFKLSELYWEEYHRLRSRKKSIVGNTRIRYMHPKFIIPQQIIGANVTNILL